MFIHAFTGQYEYFQKGEFNEKMVSHCVYGLDDRGDIYKWLPKLKKWIAIEEIDVDHNQKLS